MSEIFIPNGYKSALDLIKTERAIKLIKDTFERELSDALNLERVSAPLFVDPDTGLNDDLNGVERAVSFAVKDLNNKQAQIIHSLAKWKRFALKKYGFHEGNGLYTDMNAIRRDEDMDNLHSIYVDQWDWEKIITRGDRTQEYLKNTVRRIIQCVWSTHQKLTKEFPEIKSEFSKEISFVTAQELEDMYPSLTPKERENEYVREHKTVFLMQIGGALKSGRRHDGRAPDYDDWQLNGDILVYSDVLDCAVELSSMGIRVDEQSLDRQLSISGCDDRREMEYHRMLLSGQLPLTIGGGIGQSRLCMALIGKAHIGEVQVSLWDGETVRVCGKNGINIL